MYLAYVEYNTYLMAHLMEHESQVNSFPTRNIYLKI